MWYSDANKQRSNLSILQGDGDIQTINSQTSVDLKNKEHTLKLNVVLGNVGDSVTLSQLKLESTLAG